MVKFYLFFLFSVISAAINSVVVFLERWSLSPNGSEGALFVLAPLAILPLLLAFLLAPLSIIALLFKRTQRVALWVCICCLLYIGIAFSCLRIADNMRRDVFRNLADRSAPLVAAVQAYDQKHGHPPKNLNELVPEFLPEVPKTGIGAYPEYEYKTGEPSVKSFRGNPWVLVIDTPIGVLNWDQFMYFPLQNYPEEGWGGWIERVGSWAYVHE